MSSMHVIFKVKQSSYLQKTAVGSHGAFGDKDVAKGLPNEKEHNSSKHSKIKRLSMARTPFHEGENNS
jgi:hypothetical protein